MPSLARSTLSFAAGTILSRLTGLLRDMVVVGVFGASALLDAYLVAFRVPNLFRDMLAEGALGSAFTKNYSQLKSRSETEARQLYSQMLFWTSTIMVFLCSLGILFSPELIDLTLLLSTAPAPEFVINAVGLTRILFPFLAMAVLSSVIAGVLHERQMFFVSASSPALVNLGTILGALVLSSLFSLRNWSWLGVDSSIMGLACGVVLGAALQLWWQAWVASSAFSVSSLRPEALRRGWSAVRQVLLLMAPAMIGASAAPINQLVNTNFALSTGTGAVTWLNYAFRLLQLPVGVFGVAIASIILPQIARSVHRGSIAEDARRKIIDGCVIILWLMGFCALLTFMCSDYLVQLLFHHGQFSLWDAQQTSRALQAYSLGMAGYGLIKVLTAVYFALDRTWYTMMVSLGAVLVNMVVNSFLVKAYGHIGLALTSSLILSFNALVLILGLRGYGFAIQGFYRAMLLLIGGLVTTGLLLAQLPSINVSDHHKLDAALNLLLQVGGGLLLFSPWLLWARPELRRRLGWTRSRP